MKLKLKPNIKVEVSVSIDAGEDTETTGNAGKISLCKAKACKHNSDGKCDSKVEINNEGDCMSYSPRLANIGRGKPELDKPLKAKAQETERTMDIQGPPKMRDTNRNKPVTRERTEADTGNMVLLKT